MFLEIFCVFSFFGAHLRPQKFFFFGPTGRIGPKTGQKNVLGQIPNTKSFVKSKDGIVPQEKISGPTPSLVLGYHLVLEKKSIFLVLLDPCGPVWVPPLWLAKADPHRATGVCF